MAGAVDGAPADQGGCRMNAKTIEVKASHLSLISHPDEITRRDQLVEATKELLWKWATRPCRLATFKPEAPPWRSIDARAWMKYQLKG
jgi:hypothetical protein